MTTVFVFVLIAGLAAVSEGNIYTEGGSYPGTQKSSNQGSQRDGYLQPYEQESDIVELINSNRLPVPSSYLSAGESEEENGPSRRQLAGIIDELSMLRDAEIESERESEAGGLPIGLIDPQSIANLPLAGNEKGKAGSASEIEELRKFGQKIKELASQQQQEGNGAPEYEPEVIETEEEEVEAKPKSKSEKPLTAQKKGQSEFVEFVEPAHHAKALSSNKLKNVEYMEKRVVDSARMRQEARGLGLISTSGNIVFIAFVTMCCVLSVVGIVGGAYYYNHVRSIREDPFDDFTRYSPAGPGRDKQLKKGKGKSNGNANFTSEKGDDTLAYRAQLHHYQQTKQKIIGGGDEGIIGGGNGNGNGHVMNLDDDASDKSDDEGDLEHNFSVYECPGLAPTGDIEVQNPNFVEAGKPPPPYQPPHHRDSPTH